MPSRNSSERPLMSTSLAGTVIRTAYADAFTVVDPARTRSGNQRRLPLLPPRGATRQDGDPVHGICEAADHRRRSSTRKRSTERLPSGRKTVVEDGAKPKPLRAKGKIRRDDEAAAAAAAAAAEAARRAQAERMLPATQRSTAAPLHRHAHEQGRAQDEPDQICLIASSVLTTRRVLRRSSARLRGCVRVKPSIQLLLTAGRGMRVPRPALANQTTNSKANRVRCKDQRSPREAGTSGA